MQWLVLVLALAGLAAGGHHFVLGAAHVGRRLGMNSAVIGATIIAVGTSLPELAISVGAALKGLPDLSTGNVIGSNVCNVCIILGLTATIAPVSVSRAGVYRDGSIMLVATGLLLAVAADGRISQAEGLLLLGLSGAVILLVLRSGGELEDGHGYFRWWDVPRAILALVLVLVSARYFVLAAQELAREFGVSEWMIGITVAAIGTSLPELVTALIAALQKRPGIAVGNVLGSNSMNILFVLGSVASLGGIESGQLTFAEAALFAGLMAVTFLFLATQRHVTRWEGLALLGLGLAWYVVEMAG